MNASAELGPEPEDGAMSTRDRLLQAVIEIAGREGQHMVTYRSVAARASVTHGLVRHYFGTREAMLNEAMQLAARQDLDVITLSTDSVNDFASGTVEALAENWHRQFLMFDLTLNAIRGVGDREAPVELYDSVIAEVSQTLRNLGVDDPGGTRAALLLAALDGVILQHVLYGSDERTEAMLAHLRELLGLLASSP